MRTKALARKRARKIRARERYLEMEKEWYRNREGLTHKESRSLYIRLTSPWRLRYKRKA